MSSKHRISLKEAVTVLAAGYAHFCYGGEECTVKLVDLDPGNPDNEFMYCAWTGGELKYYAKFRQGDNETVEVDGPEMTLTDIEGDAMTIVVVVPLDIAKFLKR